MKIKIITMLAMLITTIAVAQTTQNVTVNIKLHPIQSLIINPIQQNVDLDYYTKEDYEDGVSVVQADHLEIYSTGSFQIVATTNNITFEGTADTLPLNTLLLTPTDGSNPITSSTKNIINLSQVDQVLVSSTIGGANKTFNVEYKGEGNDEYLTKYYNSESPTIYTAVVKYTIMPL
jgi:hypothetical protein